MQKREGTCRLEHHGPTSNEVGMQKREGIPRGL